MIEYPDAVINVSNSDSDSYFIFTYLTSNYIWRGFTQSDTYPSVHSGIFFPVNKNISVISAISVIDYGDTDMLK